MEHNIISKISSLTIRSPKDSIKSKVLRRSNRKSKTKKPKGINTKHVGFATKATIRYYEHSNPPSCTKSEGRTSCLYTGFERFIRAKQSLNKSKETDSASMSKPEKIAKKENPMLDLEKNDQKIVLGVPETNTKESGQNLEKAKKSRTIKAKSKRRNQNKDNQNKTIKTSSGIFEKVKIIVNEYFQGLSRSEADLKKSIIESLYSRAVNNRLVLEKKGARIFDIASLEKSLKVNDDEIGINVLMDKKELSKIKKKSKSKILSSIKTSCLPVRLEKMGKNKILNFLNDRHSEEIKEIERAQLVLIMRELSARDITSLTVDKNILKERLIRELKQEERITSAEEKRIKRKISQVEKEHNTDKLWKMFLELRMESLQKKVEEIIPDEIVGRFVRSESRVEQCVKTLCFRLDFFFALVEKTRELFLENLENNFEILIEGDALDRFDETVVLSFIQLMPIKVEDLECFDDLELGQILGNVNIPEVMLNLASQQLKRELLFNILTVRFADLYGEVVREEAITAGFPFSNLGVGYKRLFQKIETKFSKI